VLGHHLRIPRFWWRFSPLVAPLLLVVIWFFPSHFPGGEAPAQQRPLVKRLNELQGFEPLYRNPATNILQGEYAFEIHSYLGHGQCASHAYPLLREEWPQDMALGEFLHERKINALFLDESTLAWLQAKRAADAQMFLSEQPPREWQLLGQSAAPGDRWRLYQRRSDASVEMVSAAGNRASGR
jgi:hypothetical protein